jgi:hypothetical protein
MSGDGRFKPGQSGNPKGRPVGCRNNASILLDQLAESKAEEILNVVIGQAQGGDSRAAEILLARIWPIRKGRKVSIQLPEITSAADISAAFGKIMAAISAGELTPEEAATVAGVLESQRRAVETSGIEERLARLEQEIARKR